jgi:AcrR family transcriptional regulator
MTQSKKPTATKTHAKRAAVARREGADPEAVLRNAADSLVVSERRLERSPVLGPRAELTRRKLVDSASELFRTVGYANTTVADIAKHAKVSLPTFYQYFSEINDVIAVIVVDFIKESLERGLDRWDIVTSGRAGLRRLVTAYVRTYIDYADFMELWECAKLISPKIRQLSRDYASLYIHRFEGYIQEGINAGVVRNDLPANQMADVVTTTIEYYCYEHYVLSREKPDTLDATVVTISEMIADSLRMPAHL